MKRNMIRIGDIKKYERCDKLLWLSKKEPQPFLSFAYYHEDIYELSKQKLHLQNCLEGKMGDDNDVFFTNENQYETFIRMRFTYLDFRVRIPIMVKNEQGYHVYFVFASCFPKEGEATSFADQLWVLEKLNIVVSEVSVIHLNSSYVREKHLDVDALLVVNAGLFNDKNHEGRKIAQLMNLRKRDVTPILLKIKETLAQGEIKKERTNICTRRNKCPYFDACFSTPNKDTSILHLVSSSHKFKLLEEGIDDLKEVDLDMIEGTRHQYAQVMAAKNNELFIDAKAIGHFFKNVIYPISYLDFEWETYAFPPFEGMKPFDVLTFQYSLHIELEDSTLLHKEYLGREDCRIGFIEQLLEDVPKEGSIICFNVEGAEKLRLKQLAIQFPQYEKQLKQLWERMIDLAIPFSNGLIYDVRMAGMYSLKKLVSIFTDYNYNDLDISHGLDAVRNYRMMKEEDTSSQLEVIKELLAYCAMDTYAMVLIYHFLLEKIEKKEYSLKKNKINEKEVGI